MARRGFNSDEVELQLIALAVRAYKAAKLHFWIPKRKLLWIGLHQLYQTADGTFRKIFFFIYNMAYIVTTQTGNQTDSTTFWTRNY